MWTIAVKTLFADRAKMAMVLLGVAFSVLLINLQGGLFWGLMQKATLLVDHGNCDIWVGHHGMTNVDFPDDIPTHWIHRIRSIPGVRQAEPYVLGHSMMTIPGGRYEPVLVVGCDRAARLGNAWKMHEGQPNAILQTDGVIVDIYDADKLGDPQIGDLREIGRQRARIVGLSEGIQGFLFSPYVFTTIERARRYISKPTTECSYFLVQTHPNANPDHVCEQIRSRLPHANVLTSSQYRMACMRYWMQRTGIGISFGAAALLGLVVGLLIVSQTLYASVLDRLTEFGTLKAIGVCQRNLYGILILQSAFLAAIGLGIGHTAVSYIQATFSTPIAPITIPAWMFVSTAVAVSLLCIGSALIPCFRLNRIDPAMVLQT